MAVDSSVSCPLYLIIHLPTNHIGHLSPALPTSSPLHLPYLLLHYVDAFLEFGEEGEGGVELLLAKVAQRIAAMGVKGQDLSPDSFIS